MAIGSNDPKKPMERLIVTRGFGSDPEADETSDPSENEVINWKAINSRETCPVSDAKQGKIVKMNKCLKNFKGKDYKQWKLYEVWKG